MREDHANPFQTCPCLDQISPFRRPPATMSIEPPTIETLALRAKLDFGPSFPAKSWCSAAVKLLDQVSSAALSNASNGGRVYKEL